MARRPNLSLLLFGALGTEGSLLVDVELWSSDAFTEKKEELLAQFQSEYRFERGDELFVQQGEGKLLKVRLINVWVQVGENGSVSSELLAMKLEV